MLKRGRPTLPKKGHSGPPFGGSLRGSRRMAFSLGLVELAALGALSSGPGPLGIPRSRSPALEDKHVPTTAPT